MRTKSSLFHMHCFKCLVCEKQLNTGDEFGIGKDNTSIFCRAHHLQQQQHQHQYQHQQFTNFGEQNVIANQPLIKSEYGQFGEYGKPVPPGRDG
jgi:hypothetical protein